MEPEVPFEVWLADIVWGHSEDPRPVVFLGHRANDRLLVLPVSSNLDLMEEGDFLIDDSHENFAGTDLDKTSFVRRDPIVLEPQDFIKPKGALTGKLREQFDSWLQGGV